MAREPMVTRTFRTTKASLLCFDADNRETFTLDRTISRDYPTDELHLKANEKAYPFESKTLSYLAVLSKEVKETCYAMNENDFIEHAHIIERNDNND